MDARDTTSNNADLWSAYLEQQWSRWIDPFGLLRDDNSVTRATAAVAAAGMARAVTAWLAPAIDTMYRANAPAVTAFVHDAAIAPDVVAIPAEYAAPRIPVLPDALAPVASAERFAARELAAAGAL